MRPVLDFAWSAESRFSRLSMAFLPMGHHAFYAAFGGSLAMTIQYSPMISVARTNLAKSTGFVM
jgi:hypothetical protein